MHTPLHTHYHNPRCICPQISQKVQTTNWSPPPEHGHIWDAIYSPDNSTLAIATSTPLDWHGVPKQSAIYLLDTPTGEIRDILTQSAEDLDPHHSNIITGLSYSPDGSRLIARAGLTDLYGGYLYSWNFITGDRTSSRTVEAVRSISYNPNGSNIAAVIGHLSTIFLINPDTLDITRELHRTSSNPGAEDPYALSVLFNPDGSQLLSNWYHDGLTHWDPNDWRKPPINSLPGLYIEKITYAPDGSRFAAAIRRTLDKKIILSIFLLTFGNTESEIKRRHIMDTSDTNTISSFAYSPDGLVLSAGFDRGVVGNFHISTNQPPTLLDSFNHLPIRSLAYNYDRDNPTLAVTTKHTLAIFRNTP